ncbi:MAG: hypothetical protein GXP54_04815 [Deltaproteobacteria bacterium]|nr:hypothetical protein [Deltaproteobacteria bacterium]
MMVGPSGRELEAIAVNRPACPKGRKECGAIDRTIQRDLNLSGYFKVLDRASFLAQPMGETLVSTQWLDWANIGARYLIKTEAVLAAKGMNIEFRLFDVTRKQAVPVQGQSHQGIRDSIAARRAANKFINGVIKAVTGKPGIFGSRIVLSVKTAPWKRAIISIGMDGSGRRTLISNGSSNMFPRWTPKGRVLYTSFLPGHPSLYIGKKRLTMDDREYRGAAISPDGGSIVASVNIDGQSDLVLIDPKTGRTTKNLTNSAWDEVQPSWSPGGNMIAFMSSRAGSPQIHVMRADGSGERRLTMAGAYNTSPRFGPNGRIVFTGMDDFVNDIFVVDLQGNIARLTQNQGGNKDPSWSPDGRHVVFLSNRAGTWRVWIMTEDGRYQFPITRKAEEYATPDWGW